MNISVIGLGKLGACSAACFASKGFNVVGVDVRADYVDSINRGITLIQEPGLQELIQKSKTRLRATLNFAEAISETDMTFLIVPTPSQENGSFSDRFLRDALLPLSTALRTSTKPYHVFAVTSTVSPGTTEQSLIPLIESGSGRKLNEGFGVCYNPEFIALGSVIKDFLKPDLVLIGESDGKTGDQVERVYRSVCENQPRIARMSIVSAEITKISLNSYVTMKISFANTLSSLCEKIPGAHVDDITAALGADRRISPYYLKGGLSFGGPCFPRDNRAFAAFAQQYGKDARLAKATDAVNLDQISHVVEKILPTLSESKSVSVLGLSYKPNTPVIEESPATKIIEELLARDVRVVVYDPLALDEARLHFGEKISYARSVRECLSASALTLVATQDDAFRTIDASMISQNPTTIVDCWRILDPSKLGSSVRYIALGIPQQDN